MLKKQTRNLILSILGINSLWVQTAFAQDFGFESLQLGLNGILPTNTGDPREMIGRLIAIALGFLGVIVVGLILYAGLKWMTSNGNQEKIDDAKRILKNSVIGLVIIMASWAIAAFVISRLGGAIGGIDPGASCLEGSSRTCGCGLTGSQFCANGQWGFCIGVDPSCGLVIGEEECSAQADVCEPSQEMCGENSYCDLSCHCRPRSILGEPCDADTSNQTCEAANNLCGPYLTCGTETCLCEGSPVITGVSPTGVCVGNPETTCNSDADCSSGCDLTTPNGAPNNLVTIFGFNFGTYLEGMSMVYFGDKVGNKPQTLNPNCIDTWSDKQIIIVVPEGAITSPIRVVNAEGKSDISNNELGPQIPDFIVNNTERPGLCSLTPLSGNLGTVVNYQGLNLASGLANFGSYQTSVSGLQSSFAPDGLSATTTVPYINPGLVSSFIQKNNKFSNYLNFNKEPEAAAGPFISSFSPASGPVKQYVTIRGGGFGSSRGSSQVFFENTSASYEFPAICLNSVWRNDQIIVKVPSELAEGNYTIKIIINNEIVLATELFTVNILPLSPSLCKMEPIRGVASITVTAWGEYFGNNNASLRFTRDKDVSSEITNEGSAQKIKVSVPVGAITGPVSVIKNSQAGNSLNFFVGACTANSDCGGQVCCPANTYKKGRCVNTLADCSMTVASSVFEWKFNTGYSTTTPNPYAYSCAGLAGYYGTCQTGACPNTPGYCSPYAGGQEKVTGTCDYSCNTIAGCENNACTYNSDLNKCVKSGNCSLPKLVPYSFGGITGTTTAICNAQNNWEITLSTSCPQGWTRQANNKCTEDNASCSLCSGSNLICQEVEAQGKCVSASICSGNSVCRGSGLNINKCVFEDEATCNCCCTKGQEARDCCSGLTCEGACGVNEEPNSGEGTFGKCGGCKTAGQTTEERDAACNCSGHDGQFCEVNDPNFPNGVCTDCSSLNSLDCTDHSSACCMDSMKTAVTTDDVCLGIMGRNLVSNIKGNLGYGYCAYYNCQTLTGGGDPNKCASGTPVVLGNYNNINECGESCAQIDPCSKLGSDFSACSANSRCCFDEKNPGQPACRLAVSDRIMSGALNGYCAYYNCNIREGTCASTTPIINGNYKLADCESNCGNPPVGPGLSCSGEMSTCEGGRCNAPGFDCLDPSGNIGFQSDDCGTCCCKPTTNPTEDACTIINPELECLADKGNCSGGNRGLCCGCTDDNDCGSPESIGCGLNTCCQQRPQLTSTSPSHLAEDVCRNASLKIDFDTQLDVTSLNNNILLLEEREYGDGTCPSGTVFIAAENKLSVPVKVSWFKKTSARIFDWWTRLGNRVNGQALADITPDNTKLYCSLSGVVSGEKRGNNYSIYFTPQKLMSPKARYYVIVKGDTALNSQTGILSAAKIGFNGKGFADSAGAYTEADAFMFNSKTYPNSQIFTFKTLDDQVNGGVCLIDKVVVSPSNYLFKTTTNDLNENDASATSPSFDTIYDKDKVFSALALAANNQILYPVVGYAWDWKFTINNRNIISTSSVTDLEPNKILISAKSEVTEGESIVKASIDMSAYNNSSLIGNNLNSAADINVFICNNPWPPIRTDGTWLPWRDNCPQGVQNCQEFNYKFYYCRDAGEPGTLDDLPAIINQSIVKGTTNTANNLICSSDNSVCDPLNSPCGLDTNGDGNLDGICIWKIMKESYFFRETILPGANLISATDTKNGAEVELKWNKSTDPDASAYKVYYIKAGSREMLSKEFATSSSNCISSSCSKKITGLENGKAYTFTLSVISKNKTESSLSGEKIATPTDKIPPNRPSNFQISTSSNKIIFKWDNSANTSFVRLFKGINSSQYGQSFDSQPAGTSLSFLASAYSVGQYYFNLKAFDIYDNESAYTGEVKCELTKANPSCASIGEPNCLKINCCSTDCNNRCGASLNGCGDACSCQTGYSCVNGTCCEPGTQGCQIGS